MIVAKKNYRMKYNPEFHDRHGLPWTKEEKIYLCSMWEATKKADIAFALGRTHGATLKQAYYLKKIGLFNYYKKLGKREYSVS